MWSLGCVLYELCTLKLAFPAENFLQLVQSICRGSYEPISKKFYSSKVRIKGPGSEFNDFELRQDLNGLFKFEPVW